ERHGIKRTRQTRADRADQPLADGVSRRKYTGLAALSPRRAVDCDGAELRPPERQASGRAGSVRPGSALTRAVAGPLGVGRRREAVLGARLIVERAARTVIDHARSV